MKTELANRQKCLVLRNGIEVWLDEEKWRGFENVMTSPNPPRFVNVDGRMINLADVTGLYLPIDLEEYKRRRKGQWQCQYGFWHERNTECFCGEDFKYKKQKITGVEFTPEQINRNQEKLANLKKDLLDKGILQE